MSWGGASCGCAALSGGCDGLKYKHCRMRSPQVLPNKERNNARSSPQLGCDWHAAQLAVYMPRGIRDAAWHGIAHAAARCCTLPAPVHGLAHAGCKRKKGIAIKPCPSRDLESESAARCLFSAAQYWLLSGMRALSRRTMPQWDVMEARGFCLDGVILDTNTPIASAAYSAHCSNG